MSPHRLWLRAEPEVSVHWFLEPMAKPMVYPVGQKGNCRRRKVRILSGSLVIALGPGGEGLVTPEVTAALAEATDVVGYIPMWRGLPRVRA
jgi:hypothetical protein